MNRCLICNRKLKDEESRSRGIGPVCWDRVIKLAKKERKRELELKRRTAKNINGQVNLFGDNE